MLRSIKRIFILYFICTCVACTGLHYVPKDKKLFTSYKVKIESAELVKNKKYLTTIANRVIKPAPNSTFLGMRPKLYLYYVTGGDSSKGVKRWLNKKVGQRPVYFDEVMPTQTSEFIDATMYNNGIFYSSTTYTIKEKKKSASIEYDILVHPPFQYGKIIWPQDTSDISSEIRKSSEKSLIKVADSYSLNVLLKERDRINEYVKNKGFFYFHQKYIRFIVDTVNDQRMVNIEVGYANDMPEYAKRLCIIGDISVNQYYTLRPDSLSLNRDTAITEEVTFSGYRRIRPTVLLRAIELKEGEIYSRKDHLSTLSRLTSLNNFQFVSISFDTAGGKVQRLNTEIRLTPLPKRNARVEIRLVSKSNDFAGPGLNFSLKNRNSFNGAEELKVGLETSYERQYGGGQNSVYSFSIRPTVELVIPRIIAPIPFHENNSFYIPKTRFGLGYEDLRRSRYYHLNSLDFIYGFQWRSSLKREHELNPLFINYIKLTSRTAEFDSILLSNPLLSESFQEQLLVGASYIYTYNEQVIPGKFSQYYLQIKPETAGNMLQLLTKNQNRALEGKRFAGTVFAQYLRLSIEGRNYLNYKKEVKLVSRLLGGIGLAYGNSKALPYNKQFFSGGPSSLRAFRLNSVGPGLYQPTDPTINRSIYSQGGELKMEGNIELRFPIFKYLKGAVFTDAGNNWLLQNNPALNTSTFHVNNFISEVAVGSGIGLRLDLTFFVFRFDLATPFRKPWLKEGDRWVLDKIQLSDRDWRKQNLIFNIAIGYPF